MKRFKKFPISLMALLLATTMVAGCKNNDIKQGASETDTQTTPEDTTTASVAVASATDIDITFSDRDMDSSYDQASATQVILDNNHISVAGNGATASGSVLSITQEGTYVLSGTLENGQIIVDAPKTDKVQIVLNSVTIHSEAHSPIYIKEADKVFLTLVQDTENAISDGHTYNLTEEDSTVDAAIFSKADLTINGTGALTVTANYKHGIVSKDDLIATGGNITVTANGQGLSGKDAIKIADGTFTLVTKADALQSDNTEDVTKGYIYVKDGTFNITSETDGLQAETVLRLDDGTFDISTGGGSANASTDNQGSSRGDWDKRGTTTQTESSDTATTISAKALKSGSELIINNGKITIDSSDDALHSNGNLTISRGNLTLSSGDDGLHADSAATIHSGNILISKSYEGIEGSSVTVNGGEISVTSSDDSFNSAGGNADVFILITGGNITVDASGDGLDSNGDLSISGGTVLVNGPSNNGNGPLDYDGNATISGGTVMAAGSLGMAQNFSSSSTQYSLLYNWETTLEGGTAITLTDSSGKEIASFTPSKSYQSVVISTPTLIEGKTYTLSAGTQKAEVTLSSIITSEGVSVRRGQSPIGGGRPQQNDQNTTDGNKPQKGAKGGGERPQGDPGSMGAYKLPQDDSDSMRDG